MMTGVNPIDLDTFTHMWTLSYSKRFVLDGLFIWPGLLQSLPGVDIFSTMINVMQAPHLSLMFCRDAC